MNKDYTHIAVVQDSSGSMAMVAKDTWEGYNAYIESQKKLPGKCTFSLTQFNTSFKVIHDFTPISKVAPLTEDTYRPEGYTALLDAVATTITETGHRLAAMKEEDRPARVIIVIMTDGEENSSREYKGELGRSQLFEMIKQQTEVYKWQFLFIGADQDGIQAGRSIGIIASNSISTAKNSAGIKGAFKAMADNTTAYRMADPSDKGTLCFSADQRQQQYAAGATQDQLATDPGKV